MSTKIKNAMKTIADELMVDKEYYRGWQSNIAMAFYDGYYRNPKKYKTREDVHNIANIAAILFLDLLIDLTKREQKKGKQK